MKENQIKAIKATLGEDIFDVLEKVELLKLQTKTNVDPLEIKIALEIVPRTILTYLIMHLKPVKKDGFIDLELPFCSGRMQANKHSNDVYSGEIFDSENKKVAEFKYRSLPSVGLVILTTFELYDLTAHVQPPVTIELRPEESKESFADSSVKLQSIIDERLQLHNLVRNVVNQTITEREAMQRMLMLKIKESLSYNIKESEEINYTKKNKLKEFLENKNKKENDIIDKSEDLECPDCTTTIYKSGDSHIKCCICYGYFRNKEIKFSKKEGNIAFKFPKTFDIDNINMLLDTLKRNKKNWR